MTHNNVVGILSASVQPLPGNEQAELLLATISAFCTTDPPESTLFPHTRSVTYVLFFLSIGLTFAGLIVGSCVVFVIEEYLRFLLQCASVALVFAFTCMTLLNFDTGVHAHEGKGLGNNPRAFVPFRCHWDVDVMVRRL